MRHRRPSPLPEFDTVPPSVVDAAKRMFDHLEVISGLGFTTHGYAGLSGHPGN